LRGKKGGGCSNTKGKKRGIAKGEKRTSKPTESEKKKKKGSLLLIKGEKKKGEKKIRKEGGGKNTFQKLK